MEWYNETIISSISFQDFEVLEDDIMSLKSLLDTLQKVDPDTYKNICDLDFVEWKDHIQGCIQRACKKRGWSFCVLNDMADVSTKDAIYDSTEYGSPAEALLSAYIVAIQAEENYDRKYEE